MLYFIIGALLTSSEEAKKSKAKKNKKEKNSSDYVYTDYEAKIRELERKKRRA